MIKCIMETSGKMTAIDIKRMTQNADFHSNLNIISDRIWEISEEHQMYQARKQSIGQVKEEISSCNRYESIFYFSANDNKWLKDMSCCKMVTTIFSI